MKKDELLVGEKGAKKALADSKKSCIFSFLLIALIMVVVVVLIEGTDIVEKDSKQAVVIMNLLGGVVSLLLMAVYYGRIDDYPKKAISACFSGLPVSNLETLNILNNQTYFDITTANGQKFQIDKAAIYNVSFVVRKRKKEDPVVKGGNIEAYGSVCIGLVLYRLIGLLWAMVGYVIFDIVKLKNRNIAQTVVISFFLRNNQGQETNIVLDVPKSFGLAFMREFSDRLLPSYAAN
ncbi:hypothetical protein [Butyrivibrio sp. NC3005]|uniref:hypothetical protein n=1 Tax=Butyrivibrio sp. NC3005 TaxID=1280685 RepID=UPI00041B1B50|nr:hypothetical protein [Butyrivibrio sp. NC3005]